MPVYGPPIATAPGGTRVRGVGRRADGRGEPRQFLHVKRMHGDDERIPLASFAKGIDVESRIVAEFAVTK